MEIIRCDQEIGSFDRKVGRVALFDRDGVLNVDHGYVSSVDHFEWVDGARAIMERCRELGMGIGVITNQSGIGRGYYSESDFKKLMETVLDPRIVDLVVYCPHAPEAACPGRKPGARMLEMALGFFGVAGTEAFFIGDKETDLLAADAAGVNGYSFQGGNLGDLSKDLGIS